MSESGRPALVASDVGGTLTVSGEPVPPFTRRVIRALIDRQVAVAIVTGYNLRSALFYTRSLDQRVYRVVQNGGLCLRDNAKLWEHCIPGDEAGKLINMLEDLAVPIFCYGGEDHDFRNYILRGETISHGSTYIPVDSMQSHRELLGISTRIPNGEVDAVFQELQSMLGDRFNLILTPGTGTSWIEITPLKSRKDHALKALCEILSFSPADTIYFGDNLNDREALRLVGHPRVVANAMVELLAEFPDHGVADVRTEGVARHLDSIYELGIGE